MTKPITSVALMTLYEEGRFQLDDPVSRFLPELGGLRVWDDGTPLSFRTVPAERDITVRDLLTHTAGFTYGFMGRHPLDALYRRRGIEGRAVLAPQEGAPSVDLAEMVGKLGELPLLFSPGSRWSYSVATDVCGHLIERLSGQPFDAFLSERIFGPLEHGRHGLLGHARPGRPPRVLLRLHGRRPAGRGGRTGDELLPDAADLPVRRGRAGVDRRRLPALRARCS